ncbi:hypothetical protein VP01_1120g2 [Puccinia sorghi]|uniref:Kinesin motor domain-containing protein n=1 Tax=Puccinia sorghi TaxID=27349 RepID=A0A0L6VSL3_9BASI|nr:hypothetical protein VP01_1120g2 [Puccinia sorghi]
MAYHQQPIDAREFERRPSSPVRSRSSPDKKPICSGLFLSTAGTPKPVTPSPTKINNSSSKFTPTRKSHVEHSTRITQPSFRPADSLPTTPTGNSPLTRNIDSLRSHQFISPAVPPHSSLNSPLRASLTLEAIPRKKSILPGAPNPNRLRSSKISESPFSKNHTHQSPTLSNQSPSLLQKSLSHLNLSHSSPAHLRHSHSLSQLPQSLPLDHHHQPATTIEEPPVGKAQLENVLVAIRLKGLLDHQLTITKTYWSINPLGTQITELSPQTPSNHNCTGTTWNFDSVFGQDATNQDVYQRSGARDLILSAMAGYDATIFAYGQTASGKTHTLTGSPQQPGIIPLSVLEIFKYIRSVRIGHSLLLNPSREKSHPEREFLLRVSYLEVYNEQIHDLLIPTAQYSAPTVKIRQQTNGMFFADPVREEVVTNAEQVAALITRGERQRHVAGTDWNARSSRSHTIFGIVIESRLYGVNGGVKRSKVCLIDLAGNERASSEVERRSEGSFINKSLLTLEKVISGLAEPSGPGKRRSQHIPYRDSKLTQILQPSISGKSRVCVICTMNWTGASVEDSRSTLRFASRVKKIQTSAGVNEILSDSALMIRYRQQIVELQAQLKEAVNKANQPNENINHYQQSSSHSVILGDPSQVSTVVFVTLFIVMEKAEEERSKIKKQLKELQSIILNANNLDQVEGLSKETRPVSPVKKRSNQALSCKSDSESDDSVEQEEVKGLSKREEKRWREKELEAKVELQDYEIACLRLELIGLKYKTTRHQSILNPVKQEENDTNNQIKHEVNNHEIEEAVKRVAESRESIENRLTNMALEIKQRKQFTQEVMDLLDASRAKTQKLELFILNEIERSTRRLSKIERSAYIENSGDGGTDIRGGRGRASRRRSSSINSNPYELLLSASSTHGPSATYQDQSKLITKLKNNLHLQSSAKQDGNEPSAKRYQNGGSQMGTNHLGETEDSDETDTDDQDLSTLLSIVNELPEIECVRMSFGDGSGAAALANGSVNSPRLNC